MTLFRVSFDYSLDCLPTPENNKEVLLTMFLASQQPLSALKDGIRTPLDIHSSPNHRLVITVLTASQTFSVRVILVLIVAPANGRVS